MNYNPFVRGITSMVENASYDEVSHTASPGEVRMTRVSRIVCAICTPFITALTVVFFLKEPVSWLHLACAALALVCLLGTLDCFVFRIRYNSTQFTVRNFFGITRTYTCAEVTESILPYSPSVFMSAKRSCASRGMRPAFPDSAPGSGDNTSAHTKRGFPVKRRCSAEPNKNSGPG